MTNSNLIADLKNRFGNVVVRQQIIDYCNENNVAFPNWLVSDPAYKTMTKGCYNLNGNSTVPMNNSIQEIDNNSETVDSSVEEVSTEVPLEVASMDMHRGFGISNVDSSNLIPEPDPNYIPFGNHRTIKTIIKSRRFFPVYITGLSGNGKTSAIIQSCAELKRELFRVNITCETDEDDLLGGFRLVNGETKFHYGPVVEAMRRGGVLLLDEIDLASTKIMCIQPILEGKPVFLKKINEVIHPKPGFTILVTANTKGQGNTNGKFIGTNVLNEAFLDRFPATLQQDYPSKKIEENILNTYSASLGFTEPEFTSCLVDWANQSRAAFNSNVSSEIISTRRLLHVINAYAVLKDKKDAIEMVVSRFSKEDAEAFTRSYEKIDAAFNKPAPTATNQNAQSDELNLDDLITKTQVSIV